MTYRTSDGTARAGEDYAETTGTLTFTVREPSPLISVATLEDELNESDEFFTVTLLPAELPDGSRTDRLDSTLTIFDNDGLTATVSAEQTILEEGEPARFLVERVHNQFDQSGATAPGARPFWAAQAQHGALGHGQIQATAIHHLVV